MGLAGCSWGESDGDGDDASPAADETPTPGETPSGPTSDTESDEPPMANEYGTVVNLADAGADPTGSESILPYLERHAGDDTLLYLPQGRYLMDDWWQFSHFSHFGLYGDGATIVPSPDYGETPLFILGSDSANGLYVEGLRFDFTQDGVGPSSIYTFAEDDLLVRDIEVDGTTQIHRFDVTSAGGSGRVENLRLPDGGLGQTPTGCYIGQNHRGTLTMADCHIAGFWGTGIYASNSPGTIRVVGGTFVNNGIANVRVGEGDLVRNVVVRCVDPPASFRNIRGIWVLGPNTVVENCHVNLESVTGSDGAVVLGSTATVRNTTINVDSDGIHALLGNDPARRPGNGTTEHATALENVQITGNAAGGSAVALFNHDDFEARGVSVTQSGDSRNGFRFVNVDSGTLRESLVDVTGQPIVTEDSKIERLDVTTGRSDGTTVGDGDSRV